MDPITASLRDHYQRTFAEHGCSAAGVDWGTDESVRRRNHAMLQLVTNDLERPAKPSLLDVGCGYASLLDQANRTGVGLDYRGIDVVPAMTTAAAQRHPTASFRTLDVFDLVDDERYDYVVCNGILTQKLEASQLDMQEFAKRLIVSLFTHCSRGIAFNVMSSRVNFMADNLFYWSPVESLAYCISELSSSIGLDHHYLPYEYTVYVYRPA
ncbi:MAG: class I SAM-dependent methyltransferase [Planctomycetota bacterium]